MICCYSFWVRQGQIYASSAVEFWLLQTHDFEFGKKISFEHVWVYDQIKHLLHHGSSAAPHASIYISRFENDLIHNLCSSSTRQSTSPHPHFTFFSFQIPPPASISLKHHKQKPSILFSPLIPSGFHTRKCLSPWQNAMANKFKQDRTFISV